MLAKRATSSEATSSDTGALHICLPGDLFQAGRAAVVSTSGGKLQGGCHCSSQVGMNWMGMVMGGHKNIKHMDGHRWTWMDIGWVDIDGWT